LDGRYAVFGRVIKGLEVVDAIQQGDRIFKASLVMAK
ncbi:MAG: peptidylprolyl isomerase, partial [Cyanobacteriota bacterium]|nr:peptidylprolyl isomerase [Cyanobacteriota bacterium]